ncbi:MAG: hypothetical protein ABR514_12210 [Chthoniobacterales bacterium]
MTAALNGDGAVCRGIWLGRMSIVGVLSLRRDAEPDVFALPGRLSVSLSPWAAPLSFHAIWQRLLFDDVLRAL